MESLRRLNELDLVEARQEFLRCCGSIKWTDAMIDARPFKDPGQLFDAAQRIWNSLDRKDWLEAFRHHPRIGDKEALRKKFAETRLWASGEQAGVDGAAENVLEELARGNGEYESRFGYIFIVCATGKTAPEMLALLRARLKNDPEAELRVAAEEQNKITRIRLEKLLNT